MRPRWILWAAAPLGVAMFCIVRAGEPPEIKPEAEAEVEVWQFMAAASVVLWAALASVGLGALETLPRRRGVARFVAAVYVAIALLLVLTGLAGIRSEEVVASQPAKNVLLHVLAGVAVLPWLVALERIRLDAAVDDWIVTAAAIERIRVLRGGLKAATAALGGIIAGAVILTGALRGAVSEADLEPTPDAYVLVYGAWLTAVLAAIYLRVFGAIERRGRWIVDRAVPLPGPATSAFPAAAEHRAQLARELELGGDPRTNLEGLVAVLAPLASALLSRVGGL